MNVARALRIGGLAAVVVVAAAFVGTAVAATTAPAAALEVSVDGVSFAAAMPHSILDETYALVPGDRLSGQVWVRNAGAAPGFIRVSVAGPPFGDPAYLGALVLVVGDDIARPVGGLDRCTELVSPRRLVPGEVLAVPVSVALVDPDGSAPQRATTAVSLRVTMSDSPRMLRSECLPPEPADSAEEGAGGVRAQNPPTVQATLAPLGIILVAAAAALGIVLRLDYERRARRREKET